MRLRRDPKSAVRAPSTLACFLEIMFVVGSLRLRGFGKTMQDACRATSDNSDLAMNAWPVVEETARRLARAAALWPGRARCLEQSLVLFAILRRRRIPVRLRFGVQPYRFRAHAWVEYRDTPVNEQGEIIKGLVQLPEIRI
jgi:hypothetical protein